MFTPSVHLYDTIYLSRGKNYAAEADSVHQLVQHNLRSGGNSLLDIACGTGLHTSYLREHYQVEGLDLDARMLEAAKQKCPDVIFHLGDMRDFNLGPGGQFDVITCLFSSIGYVGTLAGLNQAIANFERHLKPGGLMFIEPWFTPEDWHPGNIHATFVDEPRLKVSRMNLSGREGNLSYFVFHYLVGTPEGVEYFTERHELGLFTVDEYLSAFRGCGLDVVRDALWLNGRGLYMASKPGEK
jgi:ubiquinone/menaquinone biosynthesis C-methylase UbiE